MNKQPPVQPIVKTRLEIKPPLLITEILQLSEQRLDGRRHLQLQQPKLAVGHLFVTQGEAVRL